MGVVKNISLSNLMPYSGNHIYLGFATNKSDRGLMIRKAFKSNTAVKIFRLLPFILLATAFVLLIISMIMGVWKSLFIWLYSLAIAVVMIWYCSRTYNRKVVKTIGVLVLIGFILVLPAFLALSIMDYHSVAQLVTTQDEIAYFQKALGGSYDYKELIVWEWQHIEWLYDSEPNPQRNTDPIRIFEYGKGKCREFTILYAELCISQGYQCRIISAPLNDHAWTEVKINGEWIRVDSSLGPNDTRAINYPMFFEKEDGWNPPIIALAFEDLSIVDVTPTYRSDSWSIFSLINIFFVGLASWFSVCLYLIFKKVQKTLSVTVNYNSQIAIKK